MPDLEIEFKNIVVDLVPGIGKPEVEKFVGRLLGAAKLDKEQSERALGAAGIESNGRGQYHAAASRSSANYADAYAERKLSEAVSRAARADQGVQAFRADYLPDGVLSDPRRVGAWLRAARRRDLAGGATPGGQRMLCYVSLKKPRLSPHGDGDATGGPLVYRFSLRRIAVPRGGTVEALWSLCRALEGRYHIAQEDTVMLILCGFFGSVAPMRSYFDARGDWPALSRVVIEVHPRVPVETVAEVYRRYRRAIYQGRPPRRLSEKSGYLAQHVASGLRGGKRSSWYELWERWNAMHPEALRAKCRGEARRRFVLAPVDRGDEPTFAEVRYPPGWPKLAGDPWHYPKPGGERPATRAALTAQFRRDGLQAVRSLASFFDLSEAQLRRGTDVLWEHSSDV